MAFITHTAIAMICIVCSFAACHATSPGHESGFNHLAVPAIKKASALDEPSSPRCNVSLIGYRSSYSPTSCSELLFYPAITGCSYSHITYELEGLPSCVVRNWQYLPSFTFTPFFTVPYTDYATARCDVGQGIIYTGTLTVTDHTDWPSMQLGIWNIEIDTSNMEHCAAIPPPLEIDTDCDVTLESQYTDTYDGVSSYEKAFRPTSCERSVLGTVNFSAGCRHFKFTTSYEFEGFEECTAVQLINGTLIFDVSNAFCDIRSGRSHTGILNVYSSLTGIPGISNVWRSWRIQILTGGLQGCSDGWTGQVSTPFAKVL